MRQISLDTETTGLDPTQGHRIIEIGCIELVNRRITDNHFHCYINPERDIDQEAQKIHGINTKFLADKPNFSAIVDKFIDYLNGVDEIIIHNAPFDVGFLNHEFQHCQKQLRHFSDYAKIIDTLGMARRLHPGQKNSLDALCKRYDVNNAHRQLHGALVDADLLARVYLAMTGGQESLFADYSDKAKIDKTQQKSHSLLDNVKRLPIIYADETECSAHHDYLNMLAKQNKGQCCWKSLESQEYE